MLINLEVISHVNLCNFFKHLSHFHHYSHFSKIYVPIYRYHLCTYIQGDSPFEHFFLPRNFLGKSHKHRKKIDIYLCIYLSCAPSVTDHGNHISISK